MMSDNIGPDPKERPSHRMKGRMKHYSNYSRHNYIGKWGSKDKCGFWQENG